MTSYRKFSLIVATLGRDKQVDELMNSFLLLDYPREKIEIIIVDQNVEPILDHIILKYKDSLNIIHIKSDQLGLSKNRNIGIRACSGDIVAFPDDDCTYPSNTLSFVNEKMELSKIDFMLGSIWDKEKNIQAIRKWPLKDKCVNKINFYRLTSSITLFSMVKSQYFDERFGIGAKYGSNEDTSYIYSLLDNGYKGRYFFDLVINHADQPIDSLNLDKIKTYSYGFGKFAREYLSIQLFFVFFLSISFQVLKLILGVLKNKKLDIVNRFESIKYRLYGFFSKKSPN